MTKLAIQGACLCQAVQIGVARRPRQVTQCNCSACRRYGTLWAYYKRSAVTITAPRGTLARYSRPGRTLRFVHCQTCACVICWEPPGKAKDARFGLNSRLLDHALMASVPIEVLDGDGAWHTLETYVKPGIWISPSRTQPAKRPARAAK
jgi:hypothetical protein